MLLVLLSALALAPAFWLLVPPRWRRPGLAAGSLVGLGCYDPRLAAGLLGFTGVLFVALRVVKRGPGWRSCFALGVSLCALVVLFVWNKQGDSGGGVLPSQGGLVLLGVSYLVLKAAAVLIETAGGTARDRGFLELLTWLVFLPTYPSGPIEELDHFATQEPALDRRRVGAGLERILFGLVKALVVAHYLGVWADGILEHAAGRNPALLLVALYAVTLRFYLDFAGYSDIAIGLSAVFGYDVRENFDSPLTRRNLVQLWQRWHMSLTAWLRLFLFLPISRAIMRRGGGRLDTPAIILAQLGTMLFCGLWHGIGWNFAAWGLLQALGLIWVGTFSRRLGRRLPRGLVAWWRASPVAALLSVAITFNFFALSTVLVFFDVQDALHYLALLLGLAGG